MHAPYFFEHFYDAGLAATYMSKSNCREICLEWTYVPMFQTKPS